MHRFLRRTLCALLVFAVVPAANAGTCYVTTAGSNVNTGASWASPYDLQSALGVPTCTEIWVASGVYKPTTGTNRSVSFGIRAGTKVYGGFAGTESNRNQRDPASNPTVLSGDLKGDDTGAANGIDPTVPTDNSNQDNSYNVVVMDGSGTNTPITSTTVLDGFTITGGNANVSAAAQSQDGGGLFCDGEQGGNCSPILNNLVFSGNSASYGGAVNVFAGLGTGSPTLTDVTFSGNTATAYGGALYAVGSSGTSSPSLTNVTFSGNSAPNGGGGAICASSSNPTLTNVTFSGNTAAGFGGALYQSGGSATLNSVILANDNANSGAEIWFDNSGSATLDHSLIWNSGAGSGACPGDSPGATCTNMQYADSKLGALQNNGGFTPTFLPGAGSAAIDTGKDTGCPATDQRGAVRPQGAHCDIGAVEVSRPVPCYVDAAATGASNGYNWTNAYTDVQQALNATGCSEIWVAKGVYKPIAGTDQTVSFYILPGTEVYGGFGGTETARAQRNPALNVTVLSGDLNGDDTGAANGIDASVPTDATNSDNSYHVVYFDGRATPITASTVLDGFTITAGNANGGFPDDSGGGLICNANNGSNGNGVCTPTLRQLVFSGNSATSTGGAMFDYGYYGISSPALDNVLFTGNTAGSGGGAMYNTSYNSGSASNPTLANVTFKGNSTGVVGGAIYNSCNAGGVCSPTLTNVTFSGNSSGNEGGGMHNGNAASPILTNVTFSGNSALYYGGAMSNDTTAGVPVLTNVIFWNDTLTGTGGGGAEIYNVSGTPQIDHSIVKGGCPSGSACTNLLTGDPKLGVLAYNGGFTPTFLLGAGSAAIDAGKDAGCPATDQRGVRRVQGAHCDIGSVEVVTDRIFADNFDGTPTP